MKVLLQLPVQIRQSYRPTMAPPAPTTEPVDRTNTGVNVRDRDASTKTPFDQNENKTDIGITAEIRKQVVDTKMSVNAHMAALGGAAVGGTVGGLTGALVGMGIPEFEAKRYEGKVKSGSALISVHSEDGAETKRAKEIFERAGAEDISTAGETAVAKSVRV